MDNNNFENVLWVLARVKNTICAINSDCVESILLLEEGITYLPDSDNVHPGIVNYRNGVLPIIDLRGLLKMIPLETEHSEFIAMLEERKCDHVKWVDELKRCLANGETFRMATDPHKCAFGRWYDTYKPENNAVSYQLKSICAPHRRLHETAIRMNELHFESPDIESQRQIIYEEAEGYMKKVLGILDKAKQAYEASFRKMAIVMSDGESNCGILVDEVIAIETLTDVPKNEGSNINTTNLMSGIAQRSQSKDLVLVLSTDSILSTSIPMEAI